jgi:antitoxin FitA
MPNVVTRDYRKSHSASAETADNSGPATPSLHICAFSPRRFCFLRTTRVHFEAKIPCMRATQLRDVSATPINVDNMSKMIQIRNVPDDLHRELKTRAAAEGISLSDLIKRELGATAGLMSVEEVAARVEARGPTKVKSESIVRIIREMRGD